MRAMKDRVGERTALYGLVTGPFTLLPPARHRYLLDTVIPRIPSDLMANTAQVAVRVSELYLEAAWMSSPWLIRSLPMVSPHVPQLPSGAFPRGL